MMIVGRGTWAKIINASGRDFVTCEVKADFFWHKFYGQGDTWPIFETVAT